MRQLLMVLCITALSVAMAGCGGDNTEDKADTGTSCGTGKTVCGSTCCNAGYYCGTGNTCKACECGDEGAWDCSSGKDSCGNTCGSCTSPQTCNETSHTCESTSTCGTGETECGTNCCTANQECNTTTHTCVTCGCPTGAECGEDACGNACGSTCGTDEFCNANLKCVNTATACDGVTCAMTGESCETTDGQCHCTPGGAACASGYACDATLHKCIPSTTDPCATVTCNDSTLPTCSNGVCVCSGNSCGTGKTCSGGVCVTTGTCSPSCNSGETCTASNVCECTAGTNDSCATATSGAFKCDAGTKRCVAAGVTCNGATCAPGQVCADPHVAYDGADPMTATQADKICTCLPAGYSASAASDSCLGTLGKVCDDSGFDYNDSTTWAMSCRWPEDKEDCKLGVSQCQGAGVTCESFSSSGQSFAMCVHLCTATSECPSAIDYCSEQMGKNFCWYNICTGDDSANPDRSKYFQPCAAESTGDGLCLPLPTYDASGNLIDIGACFQTGTATTTCDPLADRTNKAGLCGGTKYCDAVQAGTTAGTYQGICRETCNAGSAADPVLACANGGYCADQSGLSDYDAACAAGYTQYCVVTKARWGICETGCSVVSSTNTCPTDALGNTAGCQIVDADTGAGYCWAVMPGAANAYETCSYSELRKPCDDEGYCYYESDTSTSGFCIEFCDTTSCVPDATTGAPATCSACPNAGDVCYPWCAVTGADCSSNEQCCSGTCNSSKKCAGTMTFPKVGYCSPAQ